MGKNLRFWDPSKSAIRYASDYNNDGSDTLGIQEALDDLPLQDGITPSGKVIVDISGEISDTIMLHGGQILEGIMGWGKYDWSWHTSSLRLANGINKNMIEPRWDGVNDGTKYFAIIRNLSLDGNWDNNVSGSGIVVDSASEMWDLYIQSCLLRGFEEYGMHINFQSNKTWIDATYFEIVKGTGLYVEDAEHIRVRQSYAAANDPGWGIYLKKIRKGAGIISSEIRANSDDGILISQDCDNIQITNCNILSNGAGGGSGAGIYVYRASNVQINNNLFSDQNYGVRLSSSTGDIENIQICNNIFNDLNNEPIYFENDLTPLSEVMIKNNCGSAWDKDYIYRFKDTWVGHSLDTTHKWRGQATGTGVLPAYTAGPSFETVLFDIAATSPGTSTLDMNGQRPFDAQFNSYINGSCFIDDVSEADLYFGFYKDADEYAYFHVTQGNVYVKANDGGVHGPYSEDTLVNVGDAETFHMMVEMLRSETPRFKLNGAVVGTPTTGSAPSTGVGVDAYVHLANRNNSAIQGYLNPVEVTSGRDLW